MLCHIAIAALLSAAPSHTIWMHPHDVNTMARALEDAALQQGVLPGSLMAVMLWTLGRWFGQCRRPGFLRLGLPVAQGWVGCWPWHAATATLLPFAAPVPPRCAASCQGLAAPRVPCGAAPPSRSAPCTSSGAHWGRVCVTACVPCACGLAHAAAVLSLGSGQLQVPV